MIELKNIGFAYDKNAAPVLRDVNFSLADGQCASVLGNNGAGKSTLLKCIDRILRPQSGQVLIDGQDVFTLSANEMARQVAYVAQNARSSDLLVFDTVLLGRRPYIRWDVSEHDREVVSALLERLKLTHLAMRPLSHLSGGEAQKVLLARALAQEPRLLLLDEPTSNLDPRNQHEVMQLIRELTAEKNICVITVLHDLNLAIRYCYMVRIHCISLDYASGGAECMTPENIEAVYSMHVHIIEHRGIPVVVPFPDVH